MQKAYTEAELREYLKEYLIEVENEEPTFKMEIYAMEHEIAQDSVERFLNWMNKYQ